MRRIAILLVLTGAIGLGVFAAGPARIIALVTTPSYLYQGRAIVTGQRDETRIPGFERALADVVKKVTGDARVTADQVAKSMDRPIPEYVESYSETDRMAGIPIHDEQGTRDRPFDLLVSFKSGMVDDLVKRMGQKPWTAVRPKTLLLVKVTTDTGTYLLSEDGDQGMDQRDSLKSAAWNAGLPIILPTGDQLGDGPRAADDFSQMIGAGQTLSGHITWTSGMKGWQASWQLRTRDGEKQWQIRDVNFDEAFRNAIQGAASILSGNGPIAETQS